MEDGSPKLKPLTLLVCVICKINRVMKIFTINEKLSAVCEWKKTRQAFKHEATLMVNGREAETVKICYLNRTWERYEYESVLYKLQEKTKSLNAEELELFKKKIKNSWSDEAEQELSQKFGAVAMVAALGDILHVDQESKNNWKKRMLEAGLGAAGLQMPADWNELSEDEKQTRLDAVIKELGSKQEQAEEKKELDCEGCGGDTESHFDRYCQGCKKDMEL